MNTGHRQTLAISTIKVLYAIEQVYRLLSLNPEYNHKHNQEKAAFQGARGVKCGKSAADTVAVEVCPSTAPILY